MSRDTLFRRTARPFVCGTRAVEARADGTFRVVCATCDAGGTVKHSDLQTAARAAVRDSNRACRACGAK